MNVTKPVRNSIGYRIPVLFTIFVMLIASNTSIGCPLPVPIHNYDTILVQKQTTSKKHKIRIYPDAAQGVLFFSASGQEGKMYQLFLFDVQGSLVKQANIKNKQSTFLDNIEKGSYLFEVFSNDERIENGQVIIK